MADARASASPAAASPARRPEPVAKALTPAAPAALTLPTSIGVAAGLPAMDWVPAGRRAPAPAEAILAHQRMHGNQSVTRLIGRMPTAADRTPGLRTGHGAPAGTSDHRAIGFIRRAPLMASGTFTGRVVGVLDAGLTAIRGRLNAYNAVAYSDDQVQARLAGLNQLDRAIHAWFAAHPSSDLKTLPNAPLLRELLTASEREHEAVITLVMANPDQVPIDVSGLAIDKIEEIKALWKSLRTGAGQVNVEGGDAFKKTTFARLAKLLQTATGRTVLDYLNKTQKPPHGRDDRIIILDQLPDAYKHIEQGGAPESSYAYPLSSVADNRDRRHEMTGSPLSGAAAESALPAIGAPADLTQAILGGHRAVKIGGQKETFGAGTGALVKMVDAPESPHKMSGEANNEVLLPAFVTLGHELGHALKMRAGAQASSTEVDLLGALEPSATEQQLWSKSPEELINVTGIENKIREESGIHKRKYHKPLASILGIRRRAELNQLLRQQFERDPYMADFPAYKKVADDVFLGRDLLQDDGTYMQLKAELQNLPHVLTDAQISKEKANLAYEKIAGAYDGLSDEDDQLVRNSEEHRVFRDYFNQNFRRITQVNSKEMDDLDIRIRSFKAIIPEILKKAKVKKKKGFFSFLT